MHIAYRGAKYFVFRSGPKFKMRARCMELLQSSQSLNSPTKIQAVFLRFYKIFALYPFIIVMLMSLFVLRARWELGRLPTMYHPDPKDLKFFVHYHLLKLTIACAPAAIIAFPCSFLVVRKSNWRILLIYGLLFLAGWGLIVLLFNYQPIHDLGGWLLD